MPNVLSIDQGTTGTTALIINENLKVLAKATVNFEQIYPKAGWVEHKGDDIWASIKSAVTQCLEKSSLNPTQIDAISITNQRETTAVFDSQGTLLHNLIVWQDKRSHKICEELKQAGHEELVRKKTGLLLDPYFSGSKLKWLFDKDPNFKNHLFGTVDTWLLYKLSKGSVHATDATNASRTLLMDLEKCQWDDELLSIFGVPKSSLPEIRTSSEVYAKTKNLDFLPDGIPIASLIGDQQSALFAQGCFKPGEAKATFGTGCFVLLNTGEKAVFSNKNLLSSVALKTKDRTTYCLEASSFIAGAAVSWLKEGLGLIKDLEDIETLARQCDSSGDLVFVPALAGLGAPYWQPDAKGAFLGITRDTNKAHFARAVLEGIALINQDMLKAMQEDSGLLNSLRIDGGASANNLLMQLQADISQIPCIRSECLEATALGAAVLAGMATGIFESQEAVHQLSKESQCFKPLMNLKKQEKLKEKWQQAIQKII